MSSLSQDEVLLGLGLVVVLAVGAQLAARTLRLPAIVVLLPVGFVAGVLTDDVHPDALLGQLYQPFVSIAVGVILFEAGLRLSFDEVGADVRRLVGRLVAVGVLVTGVGVALATALLLPDLPFGVAALIGAILVVSGPTVVLPLLAFVRPEARVRSLLTWEGVLVDPIGALAGVVVFHAVLSGGGTWRPGTMLLSVAVGVAVGVVAAIVMRLLLPALQERDPRQIVLAVLMVVVAALVAADVAREDAGFVATTVLGVAMANQRGLDLSSAMEFQSSLVQLLIGVLFVLIAASVSPSEVSAVLPEALGLVAVMVLVIRPLAALLATARSDLSLRQRAFVAGLAPRGIVAGATASAFGLQLADAGVEGAGRILPIVFLVIFGTVVVYGLGAAPLARALGLAGDARTLVLVVGGSPWAQAVALALRDAGVRVRLWSGRREHQEAARAAGLPADRGRLMLGSLAREAELEEVTHALVLTDHDDFNALAAAELRRELGHGRVFRLAPDPAASDLELPPEEAGIMSAEPLTAAELAHRLGAGARLVHDPGSDGGNGPMTPMFVVTAGGLIDVVTAQRPPRAAPGDVVIGLPRPRSPGSGDAEGGGAPDARGA